MVVLVAVTALPMAHLRQIATQKLNKRANSKTEAQRDRKTVTKEVEPVDLIQIMMVEETSQL